MLDNCTAAELTEMIGVPPDVSREHLREAVWELRLEATGETHLAILIRQLLSRVRQLEDRLSDVAQRPGATVIFRIIQYIGDDPVGPGMVIEANDVALLARLNASIDVDQYAFR